MPLISSSSAKLVSSNFQGLYTASLNAKKLGATETSVAKPDKPKVPNELFSLFSVFCTNNRLSDNSNIIANHINRMYIDNKNGSVAQGQYDINWIYHCNVTEVEMIAALDVALRDKDLIFKMLESKGPITLKMKKEDGSKVELDYELNLNTKDDQIFIQQKCSPRTSIPLMSLKEYLVLNKDKLAGKDLTGVDLSDADLTGVDLTGTNLNYSNLEGVKLHNADMSNVSLLGAKINLKTDLSPRLITQQLPTTWTPDNLTTYLKAEHSLFEMISNINNLYAPAKEQLIDQTINSLKNASRKDLIDYKIHTTLIDLCVKDPTFSKSTSARALTISFMSPATNNSSTVASPLTFGYAYADNNSTDFASQKYILRLQDKINGLENRVAELNKELKRRVKQ